MALEGDLTSLAAGELLQVLELGHKSGALLLCRPLEEVLIETSRGRLVSVRAVRGEALSVAWTLYLEGHTGEAQVRSMLGTPGGEDALLERLATGELLGWRPPQELLRRHCLRLLVEVGGWRTGQFSFDEKSPSARPPFALVPPLELGGQWLEVLRRRDEVQAALAECRELRVVFQRAGQPLQLSPRARRLLERLGARADMDAALEIFHHAPYETLESLRELVGAGALDPRVRDATVSLRHFSAPLDPPAADTDIEFGWTEDEAPQRPTPPPLAPPGKGKTDSRREIEMAVRRLTDDLDTLIPQLPPHQRWGRRLIFVAVTLTLILAALALLALNLGWHRPLLNLLGPWIDLIRGR